MGHRHDPQLLQITHDRKMLERSWVLLQIRKKQNSEKIQRHKKWLTGKNKKKKSKFLFVKYWFKIMENLREKVVIH